MPESRPDAGRIIFETSEALTTADGTAERSAPQAFEASGVPNPLRGRARCELLRGCLARFRRRRSARRHPQPIGGSAGGFGQTLEVRILLAATAEFGWFSAGEPGHQDANPVETTDEVSGEDQHLPRAADRRERLLARKALRFREDRGWGCLDYVSSNRGPTPFTGLNINQYLGADRFYEAGYTGTTAVVANIEAGHAWNSHETLQHVSGTTQALVNAGSQTGEFDRHATWATQLMAGRPTGPTLEYQRGLAWEASLLSGSIATNWVGTTPYRQSFSFNTSTFITPYREAMVSGVGPLGMTADVINSSWGNSDSTGSAYGTFSRAIDGLAAISGTTVVFSAGNSGAGTNKVGGPAAGYNTIAVGALGSDTATTPYETISSFSSRGANDLFIPYVSQPTSITDPAQGRVIPGARAVVDIAAPGQNQTGALYGGTTGGNVGGTDSTGGATNRYSTNLQGTSFSSPTVAGGLGLMADAARSVFGDSSAALDGRVMQSVLQTSADKIPGWNNGQGLSDGVIRTTQSLDYASGAGRMNLNRAYDVLLTGTTDVAGSGGGTVAARGWDFGQVESGTPVDYLVAGQLLAGTSFTTTLAWFVDRGINLISNATTEQSFDDLNLEVWKTVNGVAVTKVAESVSSWNNVEHLHFVVPETAAYLIRVIWSGEVWDLISDADVEQYALSWFGTSQNAAPVVSVSAPIDGYSGVRGQRRTLQLSAADPSAADMAGEFQYSISWGDGTPIQQFAGASETQVDHVYATAGSYLVQVWAADRDGAVSAQAATASLVIGVTETQGDRLAIGGTAASDSFVLTQAESADAVTISVGNLTLGTFPTGAAGGVVVFGHTGADTLRINGRAVADQIVVAGGVIRLNDLSIETDSVETTSIYGLAGDDQFTTDNTPLRIDGGAGVDTLRSTLTQDSGDITRWTITGLNIGMLNDSVVFAGMENLDGTLHRNVFAFSGLGRVSGLVAGSDLSDVMDFQGTNSGVTVNLRTQTSSRAGRIASIDAVIGSPFADSLISPQGANMWLLTGHQTGQLNSSFQFSGFENLTGSADADHFLFSGTAGGFGIINASSGIDVLSYEAFSGTVSVNLETRQATGLTRHLGFERIVAAAGNSDTLTARNLTNIWQLTGPGSGKVGSLEFAGFENLNGGSLDDWFRIHPAGSISGTINGGAGLNVLDYSFIVSPTGVVVDLAVGQATAVGAVQQISGLIGSDAHDQLFGGDQPSVILGGAGNDILRGGSGADLLIGGSGTDSLWGGSGSDLLFGGRVAFYSEVSKALNLTSLRQISDPWQSAISYAERIALLTSGTTPLVRSATFQDDAAAVDFLFGEAGQDWYLLRPADQVVGAEPDEETRLL